MIFVCAERLQDFFVLRDCVIFFARRGCVIFSCAERLSDLHRDGSERLCDFFAGRV